MSSVVLIGGRFVPGGQVQVIDSEPGGATMKALTSPPMAGRSGRRWSGAAGLAVPLVAILAIPAVTAGGAAAAAAASVGGSLRAWGDDLNGQLGDGATISSDTPVRVKLPSGTTVTSVRAGG